MHVVTNRMAVIAAMAIALWNNPPTGSSCPQGADPWKNRPELSLPLTNRKLVIAHCMTNIIRYKGHKLEDSCNPDYYPPTGNITAPIGGLTQVNVMEDKFLAGASLDEAVEFEMRAAIRSGIDGFQFYYTMGNSDWDTIIEAYFRVADRKNIPFFFTFCISHPSGSYEAVRIDEFAKRMNRILDVAGRQNSHWLRTPDGRMILYTWYGDGLADIPAEPGTRPAPYYVAKAYHQLEEAVGERFACVISINEQISDRKLNDYLDYFPAIWLWTLPYTDHYIGETVATVCKKRKRTFTGSAFPDFYTSKLLKKGTWDMFHFAEDAVKAGITNGERKYIVTGLSYNFRKMLEFAIEKDAPIINIITWNDYPEGHHLAPETNHNDGFSTLLNYYKSVWKKEPSPYAGQDVVIAFYKKYNHAVRPSPFDIRVVETEKNGVSEVREDSIEVVTILKEKGRISKGDKSIDCKSGLQVTRFAAATGAVQVTLSRGGATAETLTCSEWITDKPYRTDRLTYSISNRFLFYYKSIFGDYPLQASKEYNQGDTGAHGATQENLATP